jgi:uncharacterized protein (TIGR04255 family)
MDREKIIRLKKNPIIESVFEIRYVNSRQSVCEFIPGILFANLDGPKETHSVPPIPLEAVKTIPDMQSVPTFSVEWSDFIILGNPFFVTVSLKPPYRQWSDFKAGIEKIHKTLIDGDLFEKITRYSIKYVDFLGANIINEARISPLGLLNLDIRVISTKLTDQKVTLHAELPGKEYLNLIDVISSDNITIKGESGQEGLLLMTDTIRINELSPKEFLETHSSRLDAIHDANKKLFFEIMADAALELLEPEYA